ncbi:MAG: hypothetical protein IJ202_08960 [Bacteroidales bacterium]|nr:hypothetical protein [Bacteroidales bacterium]
MEKKFTVTGQSVLAFAAAFLLVVLATVNAFRRDGGASLLCFCFAYIMFDLGRGFIKESKEAE